LRRYFENAEVNEDMVRHVLRAAMVNSPDLIALGSITVDGRTVKATAGLREGGVFLELRDATLRL
jgi:hypothetical protein